MAKRAWVCGLVLSIAAAVTTSASGDGKEKLVLVTVVAGDAGPSFALKPSDFEVTEGKDQVEVTDAALARDPMSIVLVVDTSLPPAMAAPTPEIRRALNTFVETIEDTEPKTGIALYSVSNAALPVTDFSANRDELAKGISTIASGTPVGSVMLQGVVTAADRLSERPAPRRAIVCVSVGTAEGTNFLPKDVANTVRKSGATLWVVSVQRSTDPSLTSRDAVWTRATEDTGGLRQDVVQATHLDAELKIVADSLLSQYTLKLVRKKDGAVKAFTGKTSQGSKVLFTHWMR